MEFYFATSNRHKFEEAKEALANAGIEIKHFEFRHTEIRSDSLEEIAIDAVKKAYSEIGKPVFVEDTGLFIEALNGFPGTYSSWILEKIGCNGILKLLEAEENRKAEFKAAVALNDGKRVKTFTGVCKGRIARHASGESGFGYDPIFIPEGHSQTFAQNIELKNKLSHRYKSLSELSEFLKRQKF